MPINPTTLKALIDTQITNETVDFAITPAEVGGRMKDTIDYTTEQKALSEVLTNKSTNVNLGTSDTLYPTQKAVKTYVDGNMSDAVFDINQDLANLNSIKENLANKSTNVTTDGASNTKYPSVKAVKDYADGLVVGLLDDRGNFNASANTFPTTGGSGIAGAIMKGDLWFISTAGTLGGVSVAVGASVRALVNNPGQTSINWNILNTGLGFTPENEANKSTDVNLGTSDTLYPTQNAVKTYVDANVGGAGGASYIGNWDYTGDTIYAVGDIVTSFTYDSTFTYQMWGTYICITVPSSNINPGLSSDWVQLGLTKLATGTRLKGVGTATEPITLKGYKRVGYIYATGTNNPQRSVNFFNGMELPLDVTESFVRVSTGSYELRYTAPTGNTFVQGLSSDNFFQYSFGMNPNITYGGSFTTTSGGNTILVIGFQNRPGGVLTDGFTTVNYTMEWFE